MMIPCHRARRGGGVAWRGGASVFLKYTCSLFSHAPVSNGSLNPLAQSILSFYHTVYISTTVNLRCIITCTSWDYNVFATFFATNLQGLILLFLKLSCVYF